jgi:hypothetical protein
MSVPTVSDLLPEFAAELKALLARMGRGELAEQLDRLPILERCRCGEYNCSHFYTAPKPVGSYGTGHANVLLPAERGLVVLDIVAGAIVAIEVLDRPDVKRPLDEYLPPTTRSIE